MAAKWIMAVGATAASKASTSVGDVRSAHRTSTPGRAVNACARLRFEGTPRSVATTRRPWPANSATTAEPTRPNAPVTRTL